MRTISGCLVYVTHSLTIPLRAEQMVSLLAFLASVDLDTQRY